MYAFCELVNTGLKFSADSPSLLRFAKLPLLQIGRGEMG